MSDVQHTPNIQHNVSGWTGWVAFASFFIAITGIYHIILGLGGVFGQDWYAYTSSNAYWFDSSAWGWSMIAGGVLWLMTAYLLALGNMFGRVLGVLIALGSLLVNIAVLPAAPVWSIIAIVMDVFVVYAIIAHGSEMKHLSE